MDTSEDDVAPILPNQAPTNILDVLPPDSYDLVHPATPGGHLQLLKQHLHMVRMLQCTFMSNELSLVHDDAFPPAHERLQLIVKGMLDSCINQGLTGLHACVSTDLPFRKSLAALANQRISTFCSTIKKVTDGQVGAFYRLQLGSACADKVNWLLENLRYIYPHSYDKGTANWQQPFHHLAIPSILHVAYWTGASAIGLCEQDSYTIFDSSRDDRLSEQEVSIPMLVLVGAAIHASLSEWKTGFHKKSSFPADGFLDAYNEHHTVLEGIKKSNLGAYHFMMHWLFQEASGSAQAPAITATAAANALAIIDFANMQVD